MYVMAYCAYTYIRYAVTNMQRLFEEHRMGHTTGPVMAFTVFSDVLGMVSISVVSQVWEVDPWMAMYGHTLSFIGFIHRVCVGNGASEFTSNFQRMGVPGVLLRRICHAFHVLLVEFCVLHDNEPRLLRHLVALVGWHVHGLRLGWLPALVWPPQTHSSCVQSGNAECHETQPRIPLKVPDSLSPTTWRLCANSSSWIVSRSIPHVTVGFWTTARFRQEEYHAHGDQLQLHRSKGHLQSFVLHRGDRTGKCHGMHGRVH